MNKRMDFLKHLSDQGKKPEIIALADQVIGEFLGFTGEDALNWENIGNFCAKKVSESGDAYRYIVILFWFLDFLGERNTGARLLTLLGVNGVVESQLDRVEALFGSDVANLIRQEVTFPKMGRPLSEFPPATAKYLGVLMRHLGQEGTRRVLTGNHHHIPEDAFTEDVGMLAEAGNLEAYLQARHRRFVSELAEFARTGKLWYEQIITPEVVEYVENDQEIQTGVLRDDCIIVRKIPYNPDGFIRETDLLKRRYLGCHCPFVREAIIDGSTEISPLWCYCTGGYIKVRFEKIFGQDIEIEMLNSILDGSEDCRFAIRVPESYLVKE